MGTEDIEKHMAKFDQDKYTEVSNEKDELEKKYKAKCEEQEHLQKKKDELDNIVQNYLDFVRKLKEIKEHSTYEELRATYEKKPVISLSSLPSPIKSNVELSKDELDDKIRRVSDLIIRFGKEVMP